MSGDPIEMDDTVRLRTWTTGPPSTPPVMLHGGPGLPDYLAPVAAIAADRCQVHVAGLILIADPFLEPWPAGPAAPSLSGPGSTPSPPGPTPRRPGS